jgi:hypothetical protein
MSAHFGNEQVRQVVLGNDITAHDINIGSITQQVILSASKAGIPFQVPPLPAHFVERAETRQALKALLLTQEANIPGTLVVSAIYGLGGIGKSTLAAALAYDPDVQTRFPDGVLWATLGQQPDLLSFLSNWIQALGDYDYKPTTPEAASMYLRTLLSNKKALLVVDDVWNSEDVELFQVGGAGCRVLVTTREAAVVGATRYDLDVMTKEQSLELLSKARQRSPLTQAEQKQAETFAEEVGYLPLALELAAAQIADGVTWTELLEDLQAEVARLEALDRVEGKASSEEKRKRLSLVASFNLSLRQLSPEQLKQFAWLGVLPEDVSITQAMAAILWEVNPRQAGATLRSLRSRALLLPGAAQPEQKPTYRIHDLMHDAAKRLLTGSPNPLQPEDLPGLGLALPAAHWALLERYRAKTQKRLWHTLPDDGYIHANLTWHLEQAQRMEELHQLLQEQTEAGRNGWYEACDRLGQTAYFVTDVARAWRLAEDMFKDSPSQAITLQYRYALITASLNSLTINIPAALIDALIRHGLWTLVQGLAYAQQVQVPWGKASLILKLAPYLPETLLPQALTAARAVQHEPARASALSALAFHFPYVLPEALEAVLAVQDERERAWALEKLAPYLPETLLPQALTAASAMQDEHERAWALEKLAPYLPETLLPQALTAARAVQHEPARASALSALAFHFPYVLPEALGAVLAAQNESERAWALEKLAPYLPEKLLPQALTAARAVQHEPARASVLSALASHFPCILPEALEAARAVQDKNKRASVLSALAFHFPYVLPEALEAVLAVQDERERAWALEKLAPYLPEKLLSQALTAASAMQDEHERAWALEKLAPYLPETLLLQALTAARAVQHEPARASALSALAFHFPYVLPEALEAVLAVQHEPARAWALEKLAPYLPEKLLPQALTLARFIRNEFNPGSAALPDRADFLSRLAPYLPEKLLPQALTLARLIGDEYSRAQALKELVPYLPEKLLPQALTAARAVQDKNERASVLSALASSHFPCILPEALEAARAVQDKNERASVLSALASHFPCILPEALEAARAVQHEYSPAQALKKLAPYLPETLLPQALTAARAVQDKNERASALSALAFHFPCILPEALEAARAIEDECNRVLALSKLVSYFPDLLPEVLEAERTSRADCSVWGSCPLVEMAPYLPETLLPEALLEARLVKLASPDMVFGKLVPYLPETLLSEALSAVCDLVDEVDRAHALRVIAAHLPERLLPQALAAARAIQNDNVRALALCGVAVYLPDVLAEALTAVYSLKDVVFRPYVLSELLPELKPDTIHFSFWCEILHTLVYLTRQDFLKVSPYLSPAIINLGDIQALAAIAQAIQDVGRQWP